MSTDFFFHALPIDARIKMKKRERKKREKRGQGEKKRTRARDSSQRDGEVTFYGRSRYLTAICRTRNAASERSQLISRCLRSSYDS